MPVVIEVVGVTASEAPSLVPKLPNGKSDLSSPLLTNLDLYGVHGLVGSPTADGGGPMSWESLNSIETARWGAHES